MLRRGDTLASLLLIKVELQKPHPPLADTLSCIAREGSVQLSLVGGLYLWHMNRRVASLSTHKRHLAPSLHHKMQQFFLCD